jgi:hypothetical protein
MEEMSITHLRRLFDVYRQHLQALQSYEPQPFAVQITLFNAADVSTAAARDQDREWS